MGALIFDIGDDLQKLFRRYCRNMAGGKVLDVSGNNVIGGKPFSNSKLDRIFKIVPCQVQSFVDVVICYGGWVKDLQEALYGLSCSAFSVFFSGNIKDVGYSRCRDIAFNEVLLCQAENQRRVGVPRMAV